ncbi:hypothetical protein TSUD_114940 [Trifolium subterraneum]|uniref:Uncharacterized protein n=1 Tax=Trifolium subterraneum TaxID=3900 RepID=A0A2Z6PDW9_TRISU|nr:hypothetical protein TSUD_114940 [Trifolium subterraneum]
MLKAPLIPQPPPSPPKITYSFSGLLSLSFHHLLLLSFFVTSEKFSSYAELRNDFIDHTILYVMHIIFEILFGLVFMFTMPNAEENGAIQHVMLLFTNYVISSMMSYLFQHYIAIVTFLWWTIVFVLDLRYLKKEFCLQFAKILCAWLSNPETQETELAEKIRIAEDDIEKKKVLLDVMKEEEKKRRLIEIQIEGAAEEMIQKLAEATRKKEETERKLGEIQASLAEENRQKCEARRRLMDLETRLAKAISQKTENEERLVEATTQNRELEGKLAKATTQKIEIESRLFEATTEKMKFEKRLSEATAQMMEMEVSLSQATAEKMKFESRLVEAQNTGWKCKQGLQDSCGRSSPFFGVLTHAWDGIISCLVGQHSENEFVSECASVDNKSYESGEVSTSCDFNDSRKTSICRASTGSEVSEESNTSSLSSALYKPHKANDIRWEAIQAIRARDGMLEMRHFRLLK